MLLALPTELFLCVGSYLDPPDLNALIQSARTPACLLTKTLYDLGLFVEIVRRHESPPAIEGPIPRLRGTFDQRTWKCASTWKSEYITNYLANAGLMRTFWCPEEEGWVFICHKQDEPYQTIEQPLLSAMVRVRNTEMMETLLARGALEIDLGPDQLDTPLGLAVRWGYEVETGMLLDAGADVLNAGELSILGFAALRSSESLTMKLVQAVRDATSKTAEGGCEHEYAQSQVTALILDQRGFKDGALPIAIRTGNRDIVKLFLGLVERDAVFLEKNLLLEAIQYKYDLEIIRHLVEGGADIFSRDDSDRTPLEIIEWEHRARTRRDTDNIRDLERARLILQADPYIWPTDSLLYKLWKIAGGGRVEAGQLSLLNHHLDNKKGALHYNSKSRGSVDVLSLCDSEWNESSSRNIVKMLELLLDAGADAGAANCIGETLLSVALRRRHAKLASLILRRTGGQPPIWNQLPSDVLKNSINEGNRSMVELLLKLGVQRIPSISQSMVLHLAAGRPGNGDIIKLLVCAGYTK